MAETGSGLANRMCSVPDRAKLFMAVMLMQCGYSGNHVILRTALNMGVSKLVFPAYRNIVALIVLLPFAYFLEKKDRPALTLSIIIEFFLIALIGITLNQAFYLVGLDNTSPTLASATENAVPAITFLMAALLRMEQVHWKRKDGIAKVVGTLLSVAGATVITLYKGPTIFRPSLQSHHSSVLPTLSLGDAKGKNWTFGCMCLIIHCLCWAAWIVLQAPLLKKYPTQLSLTSYTCFFAILQFLVIAAVFEKNSQAWLIHSGGEFFSIFYSGAVVSGMAFSIQAWIIDRAGPVFVSAFLPVQTLLVAIMASLALGEEFYLGAIIGAVLIVAGLYLVVWGKSEESRLARGKTADPFVVENTLPTRHGKSSLIQPLLPPHSDP